MNDLEQILNQWDAAGMETAIAGAINLATNAPTTLSQILAKYTGTPNGAKFLRDDGSWQVAQTTDASALTTGTLPLARLSGIHLDSRNLPQLGNNGILSQIATPVSCGSYPMNAAVDPTGRFVYVSNNQGNTIAQFVIGPSGSLTKITTDIASGSGPYRLACDYTGRYVYVVNTSSATVSQYAIGTNGALSTITTAIACGSTPYQIACHPTGPYVYAVNYGDSTISQYSIGSNGALTLIGTLSGGSGAFGVACHPSGRYVYVANYTAGTVSQYSVGTDGSLTSITTAIAAGTNPFCLACDPSGRFVYVANYGANTVSQYSVGTDGSLTSITTAISSGGGQPVGIGCEPTGRFLYVANYQLTSKVQQFTIGNDGSLTATTVSTSVGTNPHDLAISPCGRWAYFPQNAASGTVSQYSLNSSTAILNESNVSSGGLFKLSFAGTEKYRFSAALCEFDRLSLGGTIGSSADPSAGGIALTGRMVFAGAGTASATTSQIFGYAANSHIIYNTPSTYSHSFRQANVDMFIVGYSPLTGYADNAFGLGQFGCGGGSTYAGIYSNGTQYLAYSCTTAHLLKISGTSIFSVESNGVTISGSTPLKFDTGGTGIKGSGSSLCIWAEGGAGGTTTTGRLLMCGSHTYGAAYAAGITLFGNTHANTGQAEYLVGGVAGASHKFYDKNSTMQVRINENGLLSYSKFGINGVTPVTTQSVSAASTDLATVITLCNGIRTALIAFGLVS